MRLPVGIVIMLLFCAYSVQAAIPGSDSMQPAQLILIKQTVAKQTVIKQTVTQHAVIKLTLAHQRRLFQQAHRALNRHDMKQFHRLYRKLADYSLTPYLDIWYARKTLKQGDDKLLPATLARYADIPETVNLRRAWVKSLAKRGRWSQADSIMIRFPSLRSRLPDVAMLILWHTGQQSAAMNLYSMRWQHGKAVQFSMVGLHQAWLRKGHPSRIERWNRIEKLARRGRWKSIRRLAKPLPRSHKQWLKYWRSVQRHPDQALKQWPANMTEMQAIMILQDGIKRLSRSDPEKAWQRLQGLKQRHLLTEHQAAAIRNMARDTALRAARRHMSDAAAWLAGLPAAMQDKDTRSWRARLYILQQDWRNTLEAIAAMPQAQQQQSRWVYWSARAAEGIGEPEAARFLLTKLAKDRGYYSFLSAEHLGQPLSFSSSGPIGSNQATDIDPMLASIKQMPAIQRAYEWLQLGKRSKAAREWHHALSGASRAQWQAAAVLAAGWHWHDQVIRAAFKAGKTDAVPDRFPIAFRKYVIKAAGETGLNPASIWSIIRQESAFNQQAVSYVGAKGLMQLMPATARKVARKLGMGKAKPKLFSPGVNIRIGSAYLAAQKARFGNLALAAAAYNAGPYRVSKWLRRTPFDAPEAWVEAIPFNETRRYVQQVMAFVSVYEWRQHKPATSLIARLHEQSQKVSMVESHAWTIR